MSCSVSSAHSSISCRRQTCHDRLENILRLIIEDASAKAEFSGARIDVAALAAIRFTREARIKQKTEELPCIAVFRKRERKLAAPLLMTKVKSQFFPAICRPIHSMRSMARCRAN
jgi:predicted YcjX-like family ATPase